MPIAPRRSYVTTLTDDELTILDVMFDCGSVPAVLLRSETFYPQWLLRHSLTDDELLKVLERFVAEGWLQRTPSPTVGKLAGQTSYGMTAAGGAIWESERRPDWNRYTTDSYGGVPIERANVTIQALSEQAREDFWRLGKETRYFTHTDGRVRRFVIRDYGLIPWKPFPQIYVLIAILNVEGPMRADWKELEARRTWWRRPFECWKFFAEH